MSADSTRLTTAPSCHFQTSAHAAFPAPSISDFYFKPIFTIASVQFTKPGVLIVLARSWW